MWYSKRGPCNYRKIGGQSYQLSYAESQDGIKWNRDHNLMFDRELQEWSSQMTCYASTINHKGKVFMFYNGNQFGKTGLGFATAVI